MCARLMKEVRGLGAVLIKRFFFNRSSQMLSCVQGSCTGRDFPLITHPALQKLTIVNMGHHMGH